MCRRKPIRCVDAHTKKLWLAIMFNATEEGIKYPLFYADKVLANYYNKEYVNTAVRSRYKITTLNL